MSERRSISIYSPTTEFSSFEVYSSLDVEQLHRAYAGIDEAEKILKGIQACLSTQSMRGRQFNLSQLYQARTIAHAYKYPIELVLEKGGQVWGVR